MSRRRKLEKFADLLTFQNVFELEEIGSKKLRHNAFTCVELKGKWKKEVFKNEHPICLELACGRGEYALQLARKYPGINYIGVDIKGARIWKGAKMALNDGIENLAFLRTRIEQLANYFDPGEVDEAWITFPDPFPSKENRRMTSPGFLSIYRSILKPGGRIHLKTDDADLFDYSKKIVKNSQDFRIDYENRDIYSSSLKWEELGFKTYYEKQHLQNKRTIKYLLFSIIT